MSLLLVKEGVVVVESQRHGRLRKIKVVREFGGDGDGCDGCGGGGGQR